MTLFKLTVKAWGARKLSITLSVLAVATGISLFLGIEKIRKGVEKSFTGTISKTDLVIGARTDPTSLLLSSVFHIGNIPKNIGYSTYQTFKNHPLVSWTIPISLGDSHRGFRVIGTENSMYEHLTFRQNKKLQFQKGVPPQKLFDVVIGSDVAEILGYDLRTKIVLSHGISKKSILEHEDKPFQVSGILKKNFTPLDRALLVSLRGIEAIHYDWKDGVPPLESEAISGKVLEKTALSIKGLSSFFVGLKSRINVLTLQREINAYKEEPLTAAIPAMVLAQFWKNLGYAKTSLQIISALVILVSLATMLISIYSSLNERRREMAIFRAIGIGPFRIFSLFLFESVLLTLLGVVLGWVLVYTGLVILSPTIESVFGIYIPVGIPDVLEFLYIAAVLLMGFLIGLVPAYRAYRNVLIDGLTIRA